MTSFQADLVEEMYNWLEADLQKAQANRKNIPWIVVHGHRSVYCSCDGDCDAAAATLRDGCVFLLWNREREREREREKEPFS